MAEDQRAYRKFNPAKMYKISYISGDNCLLFPVKSQRFYGDTVFLSSGSGLGSQPAGAVMILPL
jgi:hypothetical protein